MIIAIDGPSGVGKGTVARAVADALGFQHVDTGSMYRGVAWRALHDRVPLDDEPALAALAERLAIETAGGGVQVDGVDVTAVIRNPDIDRAAARVARVPGVRAALVALQRRIGSGGGLVMEGRDIGTVVFPDAPVKIYLDASSEERARRRLLDAAHSGPRDAAQVASELAARDRVRPHADRGAAGCGAGRPRDRHDRRAGGRGRCPGPGARQGREGQG